MRSFYLAVAVALVACSDGTDDDPVNDGVITCPEGYLSGVGNVFPVESPGTVAERELPCLNGDGTLRGYLVASIGSSLVGSDGYEPASAEDLRFMYEPGDPRFDEVQAYYLIAGMAGWVASSLESTSASAQTLEVLRTDEVLLDYDNPEVVSRQWCGLLTLGMQRITDDRVNADVLLHEFGHHVVYSLNRNLENSMLHEGLADYLAAAFTDDSTIEPSESPAFDRSLENDHSAPEDVITRQEYCQQMLDTVEDEGLEETYSVLVQTLHDCLAGALGDLDAPEQHWASMILSAALWEIRGQVGGETFDPTLFEVLSGAVVRDTGELMTRLIEADAARSGGTNEAVIRQAFVSRGIGEDLGLAFRDMGFGMCP